MNDIDENVLIRNRHEIRTLKAFPKRLPWAKFVNRALFCKKIMPTSEALPEIRDQST